MCRVPGCAGQQEGGGEQEYTGCGERPAWAGGGGEKSPQRDESGSARGAAHRPGCQDTGDAVVVGSLKPVGGHDRVEDAGTQDQDQLGGHHDEQARQTGANEHEAERPAGAQSPEHAEDCGVAVARRERSGEPRTDQAADAWDGESETVLPGLKSELAEHEDGQWCLASHDQPVDHHRVEEQQPEFPVADDVVPALGQASEGQTGGWGRRSRFPSADRGDAQDRQEIAGRVGSDGHDGAEQSDRGAAERRTYDAGRPGRGLEPGVGHQQVRRLDEGFEERAAGGGERDVGGRQDNGDADQLPDAQHAQRVGDGN